MPVRRPYLKLKIPKDEIPRSTEPFYTVAVDIISPLAPMSSRRHRYTLTIVDTATRYPVATPLKTIDTVTVTEALIKMFWDKGMPKEILSDNGSQFTLEMMTEVHRL